MTKHLATCGSIGWSGRRCGTTYGYTPRAVFGMRGEPWFRFRNSDCERICREAWSQPEPMESELFVVAPESERPAVGTATLIYASDLIRQDPLVKWEGEAMPFGKARFYHCDGTPYFEWCISYDGVFWSPAGRLLKLKREVRSDPALGLTEAALRARHAQQERDRG